MQSPLFRWTITAAASVALVGAMVPTIAYAQRDPRLDPTCWPKDQCLKRAQATDTEGKPLFPVEFQSDPSCDVPGGEWGRCFPRKSIPIQFKIPGLAGQEVSDLGQYIQAMYKFAVFIGAGLAVLIIMIAGLMYLTSAGTDRLATAKQWIANALTGLLLVVLSYLILNTVNPDLTRLSLPGTMLIRPLALGATFCEEVPEEDDIFVGDTGQRVERQQRKDLPCGTRYGAPGVVGAKFCFGRKCTGAGEFCAPAGGEAFQCVKGHFGGEIKYINDWDVTLVNLVAVCTGSSIWRLVGSADIALLDATTRRQQYTFASDIGDRVDRACGGAAQTRGFLLLVRPDHPGFDDAFVIGRRCGGTLVSVKVGSEVIETSAEINGHVDAIDAANFLPFAQVRAGGFSCNIDTQSMQNR